MVPSKERINTYAAHQACENNEICLHIVDYQMQPIKVFPVVDFLGHSIQVYCPTCKKEKPKTQLAVAQKWEEVQRKIDNIYSV